MEGAPISDWMLQGGPPPLQGALHVHDEQTSADIWSNLFDGGATDFSADYYGERDITSGGEGSYSSPSECASPESAVLYDSPDSTTFSDSDDEQLLEDSETGLPWDFESDSDLGGYSSEGNSVVSTFDGPAHLPLNMVTGGVLQAYAYQVEPEMPLATTAGFLIAQKSQSQSCIDPPIKSEPVTKSAPVLSAKAKSRPVTAGTSSRSPAKSAALSITLSGSAAMHDCTCIYCGTGPSSSTDLVAERQASEAQSSAGSSDGPDDLPGDECTGKRVGVIGPSFPFCCSPCLLPTSALTECRDCWLAGWQGLDRLASKLSQSWLRQPARRAGGGAPRVVRNGRSTVSGSGGVGTATPGTPTASDAGATLPLPCVFTAFLR